MPITSADVPNADDKPATTATDKPEPKATKPAAKSALAAAAASTDPAVQKLMWDRGAREDGGGDVTAIDEELRKLGFDV
jgi:hypothetical protein